MIREQRISRLEDKIRADQKTLAFALSWPLYTAYHARVIKCYPGRIEKLVDRLLKAQTPGSNYNQESSMKGEEYHDQT